MNCLKIRVVSTKWYNNKNWGYDMFYEFFQILVSKSKQYESILWQSYVHKNKNSLFIGFWTIWMGTRVAHMFEKMNHRGFAINNVSCVMDITNCVHLNGHNTNEWRRMWRNQCESCIQDFVCNSWRRKVYVIFWPKSYVKNRLVWKTQEPL